MGSQREREREKEEEKEEDEKNGAQSDPGATRSQRRSWPAAIRLARRGAREGCLVKRRVRGAESIAEQRTAGRRAALITVLYYKN